MAEIGPMMKAIRQNLLGYFTSAITSVVLTCATASAKTDQIFEADVRPVLKARCFHCHGEERNIGGKLDVRLVRLLVAGGVSPLPAVEAAERLCTPVVADKITLIRRAYFDLLGLPHSSVDVDASPADDAPQASPTNAPCARSLTRSSALTFTPRCYACRASIITIWSLSIPQNGIPHRGPAGEDRQRDFENSDRLTKHIQKSACDRC